MSTDDAALHQNYELISVIHHSGNSFTSGHYYTFVKRLREGVEDWIECNDYNLIDIDSILPDTAIAYFTLTSTPAIQKNRGRFKQCYFNLHQLCHYCNGLTSNLRSSHNLLINGEYEEWKRFDQPTPLKVMSLNTKSLSPPNPQFNSYRGFLLRVAYLQEYTRDRLSLAYCKILFFQETCNSINIAYLSSIFPNHKAFTCTGPERYNRGLGVITLIDKQWAGFINKVDRKLNRILSIDLSIPDTDNAPIPLRLHCHASDFHQNIISAHQDAGLEVLATPRLTLLETYKDILISLERLIPASSLYRQSTTALISKRLDIVKAETDVNEIERLIDGGQVEELVKQGQDELKLVKCMGEWKAWEEPTEFSVPGQWTYFEKK